MTPPPIMTMSDMEFISCPNSTWARVSSKFCFTNSISSSSDSGAREAELRGGIPKRNLGTSVRVLFSLRLLSGDTAARVGERIEIGGRQCLRGVRFIDVADGGSHSGSLLQLADELHELWHGTFAKHERHQRESDG